ncbi:potassium channel GORK-like isoform X1 [Histomonas meleagridis]|uniref:potassium channel GORK-like isoform X1 n=1 Tax=Histomonas meleagridis TaxID=135588 RepID=UPI003559C8ED|nr:potassium channel GORK-like isoform X1 [Histomonas meleagridis]KAH0800492.1 potassium channel GORK-like isoform X1 [Histomonas meleagridis]
MQQIPDEVLEINQETFDDICQKYKGSSLAKNFDEFIKMILELIHIRPFSQQLYANLVKSIAIEGFEKPLLEALFGNNEDFLSTIKFAKLLLNNGYFNASKLTDFLVDRFDSFSAGTDLSVFSFATFGSLILKSNKDLFSDKCHSYYMTYAIGHRNYNFVSFLQRMSSMDSEDLEAQANAKPFGEIGNIIWQDDVAKLQEKEFYVNMTIDPTFFVPTIFLTKIPTTLEFAAFCGAKNCVEHLIQRGANVDAKDRDGLGVMAYAIAGGSIDVIKELKKNGAVVDDDAMKIANEYRRVKLLEQI